MSSESVDMVELLEQGDRVGGEIIAALQLGAEVEY